MKVRRPHSLRPRRNTDRRLELERCEDRTLMALLVVTNNADSGTGSLRDALTTANSNNQADTIQFNLPSNELVIKPATPLPDFTEATTIVDATTQPGYSSGTPVVTIDGSSLPANTPGLVLKGRGIGIKGLIIDNFPGAGGNGISITAGGGDVISGCWIGVDATGLKAAPNGGDGIFVSNVSGNTIGGTTVAARNVISGNTAHGIELFATGAANNVIQGNYIGLGATGQTKIGNTADGIIINGGTGNTIGGTAAGAGNVISGNINGVILLSTGAQRTTLQGNYIGTDSTGTRSIGNTFDGLDMVGSGANVIGGVGSGTTNVISGNGGRGIMMQGATANLNLVQNNYIGTDKSGTGALGNADEGVWNFGGVNNYIGGLQAGTGNTIAYNGTGPLKLNDGVYINGGSGNLVGSNSIHDNAGLGIHLSAGSNDSITAPTISKVETAAGYMNIKGQFIGAPNTEYDIQFFDNTSLDSNGLAQGKTLLPFDPVNNIPYDAITTGPSGLGIINVRIPVNSALVSVGDYLTATSTRAAINDTSQFSAPQQITLAPTSDLRVSIGSLTVPALLGSNLQYGVTVFNAGPNDSSSSTLTVTLDPSVNLVSVSAPYTSNGQVLTINLGALGALSSTNFTITTSPTQIGNVTSTASISGAEIDPSLFNNNSSSTVNVLPSADLGLTVSAPATSPVGGDLTFVYSGTNAGPSIATNAVIDFQIPADSTFVSGQLSVQGTIGTPSNGHVQITIPSLPVGVGGNFTLYLTVKPNVVETINAPTVISSDVNDGFSSNNSVDPSVQITPAADLSITIASSPNPVLLNQTMTYTVTVYNAGPSDATGVSVVDVPDPSLANIVSSWGQYDFYLHEVIASLPTIPSGQSYSFTISGTPTQSKQILNTATVSNSVEVDTNSGDNTYQRSDFVSPIDLALTGNVDLDPSTINKPLKLSYEVTNNGPAPATKASILITLPSSFAFVSSSPSPQYLPGTDNKVYLLLGDIPSGSSVPVTVIVTPTQAGPFDTSATVTADETDTDTSNNSLTINDTVSPSDPSVTISASPTQAIIGDQTTYTIVVSNGGPAVATDVSLNDVFSGSFSIQGATSTVGTPVINANGISLALGSMNPGDTATVKVVVQSNVVGSVQSTASVTTSGYDSNLNNNSATTAATYINTAGLVQLAATSYTVDENAGSVTIGLTRTKGNLGAVSVQYFTSDGTAKAGVNYAYTAGTVDFADGQTSQSIVIPIVDDGVVTHNLNFFVSLGATGGGAVLGPQAGATITLVNTDIDKNPPKVTTVVPILTGKSISSFQVGFNQAVDPTTAGMASIYTLYLSGRDLGTQDLPVPLQAVVYNPTSYTVAIVPSVPLPQGLFYKLVVNGTAPNGIQNGFGTLLDGLGNGSRGTDYVGYVAQGTNIKYYDSTGNLVTLGLSGGGSLTVDRSSSGDASLVQLDAVIGNARQVLTGSVRRVGPNASGVTTIGTLAGIGAFGAVYVKMTTPPFYVPTVTGFRAASVKGLLPKPTKVVKTVKPHVAAKPNVVVQHAVPAGPKAHAARARH